MKQTEVEKLARAYYDRLFRAAMFMCNDVKVAEDLVQDTFVAAVKAIDRFEGRSSHYTWLYGIFLNKFRSWLRKEKKQRQVSLQERADMYEMSNVGELLESDMPDTSEIMQQHERADAVREALDELSPEHKVVLVLRYVEGMPYEKISGVVDCPLGTVKSRVHYALQKVGNKLRNHPTVKD